MLKSVQNRLLHALVAFFCLAMLAACSSLSPTAKPTVSPLAAKGKKVFAQYCSRCHETVGEIVVVGPSLAGVASRGANRIEGLDAPAYIRNSIEEPRAYTVDGFQEGIMPPDLKEQMTTEDLDAVVAYVLTLD